MAMKMNVRDLLEFLDGFGLIITDGEDLEKRLNEYDCSLQSKVRVKSETPLTADEADKFIDILS